MDDIDREYPRRRRNHDIPPDSENDIPPRSRPLPRQGRHIPRRYYDTQYSRNTDYLRDRHVPPYYDDEDEHQPRPRKRPRPRRRRSFLPAFLAGCTTAIIFIVIAAAAFVFYTLRLMPGNTPIHIPGLGGMHTYTQNSTQQISLTSLSQLSQLQVCDKIGNVSVIVNPQASQTSITTKKIVQAASQNDANQDFQRIAVEVQPPATIQRPLTCTRSATPSSGSQSAGNALTINTTIPNSNAISPDTSSSVDIAITLPPAVLPQSGPSQSSITVESSVGNITIDGLSGQFNIKGSTGNVTIKNAYLMPGSDIETGQGNITLNGRLITPTTTSSTQQAYFRISSEKGNIDVTLPAATNVSLDTNTNSGTIKSEFNNQIQTSGDAASYQGPLNASAGTPTSTLVIDVSLGNITLHKD
jgi:hypothetical protein